jgi:tetratricopeptide (TPR) repeat protein
MMAALEAAGLDTAYGKEVSTFRSQVRKDLADLNPDLRNRLRSFYERNKLPAPATPADQAARYLSLALTLGQPPTLDAPDRSPDLPGGLLEVLDFAPLVREFYRNSGMEDRMVTYTRAYQAEGDRLRQPTADMVRSVLTYLHTRPVTLTTERVLVKAPTAGKKKNATRTYTVRELERRFTILPDLLGAPEAINFRVIGDSYYAIVPPGIDPTASELRRAYLQFVIDPLTVRFNREIAERREQIKQVAAERERAGATVTPDIFLIVSRSLVAAADARFEEVRKLEALAADTRLRLNSASAAERAKVAKEAQEAMSAIQDATVARLADEYERGSVLVFFFAEQLKGIESSGFDIANFFPDMIASFDPAREIARPSEYAAIRQRVLAERQARAARAQSDEPRYSEAEAAKAASLVRKLSQVEELLRLKDYTNAESRLKEMFQDYPREPRLFFALAQTANLAAQDATDEEVQADRLKRALANYRLALEASSPETDRGLISRAHEAMGRIHAFMDNTAEAAKEFDAAISVGDVPGGAFREAMAGKKRLEQP